MKYSPPLLCVEILVKKSLRLCLLILLVCVEIPVGFTSVKKDLFARELPILFVCVGCRKVQAGPSQPLPLLKSKQDI